VQDFFNGIMDIYTFSRLVKSICKRLLLQARVLNIPPLAAMPVIILWTKFEADPVPQGKRGIGKP
jgi:hypothetical protein